MTAPFVVARDARVDGDDGTILADALSFEAHGARVVMLGDASAVFRLLARRATLARGTLDVLGAPADRAVATNHVGLAPADPTLPATWTSLEYLSTSARLLGVGRRAAGRMAADVLAELELGAIAKRALRHLATTERRALGVAHALLGGPPVLALEHPLRALPDESAVYLAGLVERAARGRRLLAWTDAPPAIGPAADLVAGADHVVAFAGGHVVATGAPRDVLAAGRRCVVSAARALTALAARLSDSGAQIERTARDDGVRDGGRLVVLLPEGATPTLVVEAAVAVEAPLLELVPVGFDLASP